MLVLQEIHDRIQECDTRLEELVLDIGAAGHVAAIAEAAYRLRFARERLQARVGGSPRPTVDEAADRATVASEKEHLAHVLAQNHLTVLRESLRATQSRLDALRTLAASIRSAGG